MQESRHGLSEEMPLTPGVDLYPITKAVGQEICAVHAANAPLHVLPSLFASFVDAEPGLELFGLRLEFVAERRFTEHLWL